jgi:hypothetical protein
LLTALERAATVNDVARFMALTPVPSDVSGRVVVAAAGDDDDLRRPHVTGRMWTGSRRADLECARDCPFHPGHGPALFVELSAAVPAADADARARCLEHVRGAAALGHSADGVGGARACGAGLLRRADTRQC